MHNGLSTSTNGLLTKVQAMTHRASLVQGAINVMDQDQSGELSGPKSAALYILPVNEFAGGPGVHEKIQGFNLGGISGLHFHFQLEELWVVFGGSNAKLGWELSLPFGTVSSRSV